MKETEGAGVEPEDRVCTACQRPSAPISLPLPSPHPPSHLQRLGAYRPHGPLRARLSLVSLWPHRPLRPPAPLRPRRSVEPLRPLYPLRPRVARRPHRARLAGQPCRGGGERGKRRKRGGKRRKKRDGNGGREGRGRCGLGRGRQREIRKRHTVDPLPLSGHLRSPGSPSPTGCLCGHRNPLHLFGWKMSPNHAETSRSPHSQPRMCTLA